MALSRRGFLVGCSAAIAALAGGRLGGLAFAAPGDSADRDIMVVVFLRGGCDGLGLLAPADDRFYAAARSRSLRIADSGPDSGLPLANPLSGGDFRLHPLAAPLKEIYDSKALAFVHACGLIDGTRSHFVAMEQMERGVIGAQTAADGWISRHLAAVGAQGLLPAVAAGASLPIAFAASTQAVAIPEPAEFSLWGHWRYGEQQQRHLGRLYAGGTPLHGAGRRTLAAIDTVSAHIPRDGDGSPLPYAPEEGVEYPTDYHVDELSRSLQSVARLIKMDLGLQVATVDYGGWDTHEAQADIFPNLVEGLSRALAAFYNDLARYHDRLTVVVMSEFGRRLKANESGGTDHGHGNLLIALGGGVNGGRMYGRWPGLATEQLDDGADLAITTDYRAVLSEILARRLANPNAGQVFPGYQPPPALGIVRPAG